MTGRDTVQSLLVLRKLTRAVAEAVRAQMTEHLSTLAPLLQPRTVLGDYVQAGQKESTRRADKVLKELQALYESVASMRPFNLPRDLTPPFNVPAMGLEISPVDYPHLSETAGESRKILVRRPLTWNLAYTGFAPARLLELVESKNRPVGDELQRAVLGVLFIHLVLTQQPGLMKIFEALHFPVTTGTVPELGALPITRIGAAISTTRPSDRIMIESAELTGMDAFEEVVQVDDIARLSDPLRERLLDIVRQQAPELA